MKYIKFLFIPVLLLLLSCSDSDDDQGIDGRPTNITRTTSDGSQVSTRFSYEGGRISKIQEIDFEEVFKYENGELISSYSHPLNSQIADGASTKTFTKSNNTIVVEITAEPSSQIFRYSIYLDDRGFPLRIVYDGIYKYNDEGLLLVESGGYYMTFDYNQTTKVLTKMTKYKYDTTDVLASYTYEYDENVGVFSQANMPTWYYVFSASRSASSSYNVLYLNYNHNVLKETITENGLSNIANFTYQYNSNKAPISLGTEIIGLPFVTFSY